MENKVIEDGIDSKDNSIQIKGIMAIVVMLSHIAPFMKQWQYLISGFIAVGIFFYYSAFGSEYASSHNKNYFNGFFKKKIIHIFLPYLFADLLYFVSSIVIYHDKYDSIFLTFFYQCIGIKMSNHILWYIWHLIAFLILFNLIKKIKNSKLQYFIFFFAYIVYLIFAVFLDIGTWWYTSTSCLLIGIFFANNQNLIIPHYLKVMCIILWLIVICMGEIYIFTGIKLLSINNNYYATMLQMIVTPLFVLSIRILMNGIKLQNNILRNIGKISYEIYLYHMVVLIWIDFLLPNINILLRIIFTIMCTMIVSYVINNTYKKIALKLY